MKKCIHCNSKLIPRVKRVTICPADRDKKNETDCMACPYKTTRWDIDYESCKPQESIEYSADFCPVCGEQLCSYKETIIPKITWVILCPADKEKKSEADCMACPYRTTRWDIDYESCKPQESKHYITIPSEKYEGEPLLFLEELESEVDMIKRIFRPSERMLKTGYPIKVEQRGGLIGREGNIEQEYFAVDQRIPSRACSIKYETGKWSIHLEKISDSNYLRVNEKKVTQSIPLELHDQDIVQMWDKVFVVSIRGRAVVHNTSGDRK